jgi:hypothetical protein
VAKKNVSKTTGALAVAQTLRAKGAVIAGILGVGVVAFALGRASNAGHEQPAASAATATASAVASEEPQVFDLAEDPRAKGGIPLRPMDRDIFDRITHLRIDRSQMRDVFPDRPYRVQFVGSIAEHHIGLVMIDLDRDGKFDERWDLKRDGVTRMVQQDPSADGTPVKYSLSHGRWQPH